MNNLHGRRLFVGLGFAWRRFGLGKAPTVKRFVRNNGLTLAILSIFLVTFLASSIAGASVYNEDQSSHGEPTISWLQYLWTGHWAEAVFENWESEFFQMFSYIWLTSFLIQIGSPESKNPDGQPSDVDPLEHRDDPNAPRIVRYGSPAAVRAYAHSFSMAFLIMWILAVVFHAWGGEHAFNQEQEAHGGQTVTYLGYLKTSQFWFESMQNYQSEFMVLALVIVLGIWLREKGSAESKPVHAPHHATGSD